MSSAKQTYKVCFCFRRRFRLAAAEAPAEIKSLFDRYSENGIMTLPHLHSFLIEVQGETKATLEDAQSVFNNLHELKILNVFHRKGLNLEAFFKYLFNDINPPISRSCGLSYLPGVELHDIANADDHITNYFKDYVSAIKKS